MNTWNKIKLRNFTLTVMQFFEHAECIAIDVGQWT